MNTLLKTFFILALLMPGFPLHALESGAEKTQTNFIFRNPDLSLPKRVDDSSANLRLTKKSHSS